MSVVNSLSETLGLGLAAPICLTWELTYRCNLACIHCLSSSGIRDPGELSTQEALSLIDSLSELGVFYINIGGGEPTLREDFIEIVEHASTVGVGVKFSTNGTTMTREFAHRLAQIEYVDIQVSLDGATPEVNDAIRGRGSWRRAIQALANLRAEGFEGSKLSVVVTRSVIPELYELVNLANDYGAILRLTRLRPSGRAKDRFVELAPSLADDRVLHEFLLANPQVQTADSFFHLNALGASLAGLNFCGAGRVVCLIDPVGDVYACPFLLHPQFRAGSIRRTDFASIWRDSQLFTSLRTQAPGSGCSSCEAYKSCHGGCEATKFFTGRPSLSADPACVLGRATKAGATPTLGSDHSRIRTPTRRIVAR
ncbi:MAG: mycofactocin radical SAM maturase [Ferrimicrobium sp.]